MIWLVFLAFVLFSYLRLLTYLHIYQQEEYDSPRFLHWLFARGAFDRRATAVILVVGSLQLAHVLRTLDASALVALGFIVLKMFEKDPRRASKKKLTMTGRAKRIYFCAMALLVLAGCVVALTEPPLLVWIVLVQLIPVSLAGGNALTLPHENRLQERFWSEAHSKLASLKPVVVGITGSYGKTSTKHLLGHILEVQAPVLITPGSVNTPMGVARIIREQLGPHHRFFVCEMGAYGPGSIARLCRLAPPDVGVITAIGMAHYERFKTLEAVASTKFELAEAADARRGSIIIAEQTLDFAPAQNFHERHRASTIVCGDGPDCNARIVSSAQTEAGIEAEVFWQDRSYRLKAPIFGEHHISNMVLAFVAAGALGVSPEDAALALASAPQISHRLEVKTAPGGARIIDDAYNSNPSGFASGLRLLQVLGGNGSRRILVTPGMVELGSAHDEEHRKIGELAGTAADVLLAVVPERIATLTSAYAKANPNGLIVPVATFAAAQRWLDANLKSGDVVLLENDLPDLYEKKLSL